MAIGLGLFIFMEQWRHHKGSSSDSQLFVQEENPKAVSHPLQLRDHLSNALDRDHLAEDNLNDVAHKRLHHLVFDELVKKVQEVEVSLDISLLGQLQQVLVHRLLHLEGGLHRV